MKRFLSISLASLMVLGVVASVGAAVPQQEWKKPKGPQPALTGLDPVDFVAGKAVKGNKSILVDYKDFRYFFADQSHRELFNKDPDRYSIQGDGTCPVATKAHLDPNIVTLYKGKIYGFATLTCVGLFTKDPEKYLAAWAGNPDKKKSKG